MTPKPVPDPAPPGHILWWWGSAIAAARDLPVAPRESVAWPGDAQATIQSLNAFAAQWSKILESAADLERPVAYPWNDPHPLQFLFAWVNCELMKNIAEIGVVRHLFAASPRSS